MTPIKRPVAAAGAAVLLALSLTACGGGAPADASAEDFCEVVQGGADEELGQAASDEDWDKVVDLLKEQGEKVEEVGTPEDISDDAREGFELQLEAIKDLNADDVEKAIKDQTDPFESDLSNDEKDKLEAYTEYQSETCADEGGTPDVPDTSESPAESPGAESPEGTELPEETGTELPEGLPSDFPSELPTDPAELEELLSELATPTPAE